MTDKELVRYYKNLLILQYKGKAKAEAFIDAAISGIMIFELLDKVKNMGYKQRARSSA